MIDLFLMINKIKFDCFLTFISCRNNKRRTPLHMAASRGHAKVVEVLISAGCDVNPTDLLLTTPLHFASEDGHLSVFQMLRHNGAQVIQSDKHGLNSLDIAINNERK